ncbi:hypothetical protein LY78DRAFT_80119 [Colletotrichum sublineola]|nr:hypothetical protein LY78DRAFT_80119 [Colletotrichum sublineola]
MVGGKEGRKVRKRGQGCVVLCRVVAVVATFFFVALSFLPFLEKRKKTKNNGAELPKTSTLPTLNAEETLIFAKASDRTPLLPSLSLSPPCPPAIHLLFRLACGLFTLRLTHSHTLTHTHSHLSLNCLFCFLLRQTYLFATTVALVFVGIRIRLQLQFRLRLGISALESFLPPASCHASSNHRLQAI